MRNLYFYGRNDNDGIGSLEYAFKDNSEYDSLFRKQTVFIWCYTLEEAKRLLRISDKSCINMYQGKRDDESNYEHGLDLIKRFYKGVVPKKGLCFTYESYYKNLYIYNNEFDEDNRFTFKCSDFDEFKVENMSVLDEDISDDVMNDKVDEIIKNNDLKEISSILKCLIKEVRDMKEFKINQKVKDRKNNARVDEALKNSITRPDSRYLYEEFKEFKREDDYIAYQKSKPNGWLRGRGQ